VTLQAPISEQRLRLEIVFQGVDEHQARAVAARMIDRAHEIANLPEYECDVDVTVEGSSAPRESGPGEQPTRAHTVAR
jgi:hypothetical protein